MIRFLRLLRFAVAYFAAWIPVVGAYTALIYFQSDPRSLIGALYGGLSSAGSAALIGLFVWPVATIWARWAGLGRPIAARHVAFALVFTSIWTGLAAVSIITYAPNEWPDFAATAIGWHAFSGLLIYGMIAGIAHSLEVDRRLTAERAAAERADALRSKAELAALRSQLNPHFLFNTLHSISALVRINPGAAETAIEQLGGLLRHVLDLGGRDSDAIALAEEWDLVRRQLELERLRFGDRLRVEAALDDDALDCAVPMLTLQPIVENAVRHGIAPREYGGTVRVAAHVDGDLLIVEVSDDGVGCDPGVLRNGNGVGLRSVQQRLAALYGDRATLETEATPGNGVRVKIILPATDAPVHPAFRPVLEPECVQ